MGVVKCICLIWNYMKNILRGSDLTKFWKQDFGS